MLMNENAIAKIFKSLKITNKFYDEVVELNFFDIKRLEKRRVVDLNNNYDMISWWGIKSILSLLHILLTIAPSGTIVPLPC